MVRRTTTLAAGLTLAVVGLGLLPSPAGASGPGTQVHPNAGRAAARRAPATPGRNVRYAVNRPLCAQPARLYAFRCYAMRRVAATRSTPGSYAYVAPDYATGPAGGFTPADVAAAYGVNPANGGVGQTVGIVLWHDDPHALHDLNAFDRHYGIPAETAQSFRKVNQNGQAAPLPVRDAGSSGEISLDIESVRTMCRRCRIVLVEASQASDADLASAENTAVRLGATVVNNSYGEAEDPAHPIPSAVLAGFHHPGVVITASTGDHGWYDWDFANVGSGKSANAPSFPSSDPDVVAVGGTALGLYSNGTRKEEDVWNENGPDDDNSVFLGTWIGGSNGASGGGCSVLYTAPYWQQNMVGYSRTGCGSRRSTGDVAALADPATGFDIYDTFSGGWVTVGGTSLASPLLAGMWALAGGAHGAGHPAQTLYENATLHPSARYDVTLGGNGWCAGDDSVTCANILSDESQKSDGSPGNGNPNGLKDPNGHAGGLKDCSFPHNGGDLIGDPFSLECNADLGFDGPTGVGTPNGLGLFAATSPQVSLHRPSVARLHTSQAWSAGVVRPIQTSSITGYRWSWGDGTSSTTSGSTANHTFGRAGTYLVQVTVTDSLGQTGLRSTRFTVGRPLSVVLRGPGSTRAGRSASFSDHGSSDPNTGARITAVTWSWGDGSSRSHGASASHTYHRAGNYTVQLTLTDNAGMHATRTKRVTVTR